MTPPAIVVSTSRRYCWARHICGKVTQFVAPRAQGELCVGDRVILGPTDQFQSLVERKNTLRRANLTKEKLLAVNLDKFFIVVAPEPAPNFYVIDKYILIAIAAKIPYSIIANKNDLSSISKKLSAAYSCQIIETSAEDPVQIAKLEKEISGHVALGGVSGVGKSSLIKALTNNKDIVVGEVSRKNRQGRQTTTQAMTHVLKSGDLITDLPGIQSIGLAHVSAELLKSAYREYNDLQCSFNNCQHVDEEQCEVKQAVKNGKLSTERYQSYLKVWEELASLTKF